MRGHTKFNGVALLFIPLLWLSPPFISKGQHLRKFCWAYIIVVIILANPETLDVAKKKTSMHSKSILFINCLYIHSNYSRFAMYSDVQPIYAVWWFKFVTKCCIKFVCLCDLSQNASIKCCFESKNISQNVFPDCWKLNFRASNFKNFLKIDI